MNKRNFYSVLGVAAFVIGGILARNSALDAAEQVEDFFGKFKNPPAPTPPPVH